MTPFAFSIKFAKTNQKFAEIFEICENYSLLFKITHWCPQSWVNRRNKSRSGYLLFAVMAFLMGLGAFIWKMLEMSYLYNTSTGSDLFYMLVGVIGFLNQTLLGRK